MQRYMVLIVLWTSLVMIRESHGQFEWETCNCIAFRLDDIQDYYISNAQKAVVDLFREFELPLTIGVIGNKIGQDATMVNYLREAMWDPNFEMEISNHGFNHESFPSFTLEQQTKLINDSNHAISRALTTGPIATFIPPFNEFNEDTITALVTLGMTHFSSQVQLDVIRPYPLSGQTLYRLPIGAATNNLQNNAYFEGIPHQDTWAQIQQQLTQDGFAAGMKFC